MTGHEALLPAGRPPIPAAGIGDPPHRAFSEPPADAIDGPGNTIPPAATEPEIP